MTVWKFPLALTAEQVIEMPVINRPLTIQMQGNQPCLWSLVDPASRRIRVEIRTFGTGRNGITDKMEYIGTYQETAFVWHVFIAEWTDA